MNIFLERVQALHDLFSVAGKIALVTGGSRGIGKMIAESLVRGGASVYISSRQAEACQQTAKELSEYGNCIAIPEDLSAGTGIQNLVEKLTQQQKQLDILVNNAGATWGGSLDKYPESAFDKVLNLNLKSPFMLIQALLPLMTKGSTSEDPSRIINIGSINGIRVSEHAYAYGVSKAGLHHLTQTLAHELASIPITVNAIAPGPFPSKMMAFVLDDENARQALIDTIPLKRIGNLEDMMGITLFLTSRAGSYITGQIIAVDGGALIRT